MPEYPDVVAYIDAIESRLSGATLGKIKLLNPFVLRSVTPEPALFTARTLTKVTRMGKRVVFHFSDELFAVVHLMIAGRFRLLSPGGKPPGKISLAAFEFDRGTLVLTEAGSKRRASLHLVEGSDALAALDPGGAEIFEIDLSAFTELLRRENHTVKRVLTDPRLFSGIGNAYSDEILHHARVSPIRLTQKMSDEEIARLFDSTRQVLTAWSERLRAEAREKFPEHVTAFRPEMAVHGKYGHPCPVCGAPVQRIVYAENETNYCARCQTDGKLLADRALSRLLRSDWPKSIDEL
jgi:formamidopyrimidine-DNA glycosylase